jgi:hypothetical protein
MRSRTAGAAHRECTLEEISAAFAGHDGSLVPVEVLSREANRLHSSALTEIVTCRFADGSVRRLFCKFAAPPSRVSVSFGWGAAYEASVYRRILSSAEAPFPRFYGELIDPDGLGTWLIIEYLEGVERVTAGSGSRARMPLAARWLGAFHKQFAITESLPESHVSLRVHDADHYGAWLRRAAPFVAAVQHEAPWIDQAAAQAHAVFATLTDAPQTVVHGDCYPKNILYRDAEIYAVDWEAAATAAGEVDLAALIEAWPDDVAALCIAAYCEARFGSPPDRSFDTTLVAAQLYLLVRTFGKDDWISDANKRDRRIQRWRAVHERWNDL